MSSEIEVFLSDVHSQIPVSVPKNQSYISRFQFKIKESSGNIVNSNFYDEDDDLLTNRENHDVIEIEHFMATPLNQVGLQVWQGALLLADYIISNQETFKKEVILELGAGTGLCSIIASQYANSVIATDYDENITNLCRRNIERNSHLIQGKATAKILDWTHYESNWNLTVEEIVLIKQASIIIAADVIYNDELTDSFFKTLENIIKLSQIKVIYIALEKRLNFTIQDLDVSCPAYNHFMNHMQSTKWHDIVTKEETNFSQCFNYDRVSQLELWTIEPKNMTLNI